MIIIINMQLRLYKKPTNAGQGHRAVLGHIKHKALSLTLLDILVKQLEEMDFIELSNRNIS